MRRLLLTGTIIAFLPHIAGADCVNLRISARNAIASSDVVFSGTVTKIEDPHAPVNTQVVTFVADRVWKGPAAKQQVIHHLRHTESREFQMGQSLVVFARRLDADDRERVGLPRRGTPAYGYRTFACGTDLTIEFINELLRLPSVKLP